MMIAAASRGRAIFSMPRRGAEGDDFRRDSGAALACHVMMGGARAGVGDLPEASARFLKRARDAVGDDTRPTPSLPPGGFNAPSDERPSATAASSARRYRQIHAKMMSRPITLGRAAD